jgi:hypothetical protein
LSFNGSVLSAKVKQNNARCGKLTVKDEGGSGHDLPFQNSRLAINSKCSVKIVVTSKDINQYCQYNDRLVNMYE